MDVEMARSYGLSLPHTTEEMPFDEYTLTLKVAGKIFIFISLDEAEPTFSLKAPPETVAYRKEHFDCVGTGPYLNSKHWYLLRADGSIADKEIFAWIKESYDAVVAGMTKKMQAEIKNQQS